MYIGVFVEAKFGKSWYEGTIDGFNDTLYGWQVDILWHFDNSKSPVYVDCIRMDIHRPPNAVMSTRRAARVWYAIFDAREHTILTWKSC